MDVRRLVAISILCVCSIGLLSSGCKPELSNTCLMYKNEEECYYSAVSEINVPALDNFLFFMPIVTSKKCTNLNGLSFYYKDENLNIDVADLAIKNVMADMLVDESEINGFRYELGATLNKIGISSNLKIDTVIAKIDEVDYTFKVDILIYYNYIQEAYRPYNFIAEHSFLEDNKIVKVVNFTPSYLISGAKITQVYFKTISDNKVIKSKISLLNDEHVDLDNLNDCVGYTLEGSQSYTIYVEITDEEDYFFTDNLYLTVSFEGREYEYCSDVNKMFGSFYFAQLCDITRIYF